MSVLLALVRRAAISRRWVLGTAFAAGLAFALAVDDRPAGPLLAQAPIVMIGDAAASGLAGSMLGADTPSAVGESSPPAQAPAAADKPKAKVDAEISISEEGVVIRKNRDRSQVVIDHEDWEDYASFQDFVEQQPWLAGLVFMVTALVFLVPLLVIILVIWYKMRSNRMRNETMLKLAERGVVTPAAAMDAVAASPASSALQNSFATAPLVEQARQAQRRAAWSDLRKGVIMGGIGLGLTFWSMLDEGSANGFGLVLLFVGIGYVVLWYFEERQLALPRDPGRDPSGGA